MDQYITQRGPAKIEGADIGPDTMAVVPDPGPLNLPLDKVYKAKNEIVIPFDAFPISHLSFSSLKNYLSNPAGWYRQYVLKQYDNDLSPAALVGRTIHKQLECFYKGLSWEKSFEITASFFEENVRAVTDWKKTGSPEKCWNEIVSGLRDLKRAIAKRKLPKQDDGVLFVESPLVQACGFSIPIKVIPDLAVKKKSGIDIYDWKKVSAFNETAPAVYWIQAYFNIKVIEKQTGEFVRGMTFVEIKPKTSKTADLSEAIRTIVIPNNPSSIEFRAIRRLIDFMLKDIAGVERHFLPNVTDMYAGDDEWMRFLEETNNDPAYSL